MHPGWYRILVVVVLGGCYAATIAPDLTWAHFSADGGDLIAAAAVNGVPHPTGYPLYLLLAKAFLYLPLGAPAFRTNVLSALCTVLASLLLFDLLDRQLKDSPYHSRLALAGALAFGLAPAVWAQALVTEVYALHSLLIILCLQAFLSRSIPGGEWSRGFVFGLAASNHLTSVLILPLLAFHGDLKKYLLRFVGLLSGLLPYLLLPVWASSHPPVNWGNPSTLHGLWDHVSGMMYRGYVAGFSPAVVVDRLRSTAGLALAQFTVGGMILAFYGLLAFRPRRILFATIWLSIGFLAFSVLYASYDSLVYLNTVWLCIAIWMTIGLGDLLEKFKAGPPQLAQIVSYAAVLLLLLRIPFILPKVDVSDDRQVQEFITTTLAGIPPGAMVFVAGDEHLFSLWYAQFVLHRRDDIAIVSEGLLQFRWYLENLGMTYPGMNVPALGTAEPSDLAAANALRPVCYLHKNETVDCFK